MRSVCFLNTEEEEVVVVVRGLGSFRWPRVKPGLLSLEQVNGFIPLPSSSRDFWSEPGPLPETGG